MTALLVAQGHVGTAEEVARAILARNGEADPHPMLLADTVREVEYHGEPYEAPPEWEVQWDEWPVPCTHPSCWLIHKRYYEGAETTLEEVMYPSGDVRREYVTGYHDVMRGHWLVMHNGERVDDIDPSDTKREAKAKMRKAQG